MKTRNRKPVFAMPEKKNSDAKVIKLKVDYRTTIVVRSQKALEMWMGKYPNAKIVA
ncbi:MAG TPA: hypothetical protein VI731_06350 [Bacteroidia bacterium]|nr:hypothetical protein [Bacteroidia bacterium]